jgi:hypothetical protein
MNTEVEETVRVFGKRLEDGTALFSVSDLDNQLHDLAAIDDLLIATANRFGSSVARALKVETREIDLRVDYAILSSNGEIRFAIGAVPLELAEGREQSNSEGLRLIDRNGKNLVVYHEPILNSQGQVIAKILVPKDVTAEQKTLRQIAIFNLWLAVGAWTIAVVLLTIPLVRYELDRKSLEISLEEALQKGEGQSIEFKSKIHDEDLARLVAAGRPASGATQGGDARGLIELRRIPFPSTSTAK